MKRNTIVITVLIAMGAVAVAQAQQTGPKAFTLSCVLFEHKESQVVLRGHVDADKLQAWFKSDYPVAGERIETPTNATAFGVLLLTDGAELLVIPCYTWRAGELTYFACQSYEIGHAPMFTVMSTSRKAFIKSLKERLNEIGTAEQPPA